MKAYVEHVAIGRKNPNAIYVQSRSGNIYRLKDATVTEQKSLFELSILDLCTRISNRGVIDTKQYIKCKKPSRRSKRNLGQQKHVKQAA